MRNETRKLFTAYLDRLAQLNGVTDPTMQFTVEPSVSQKLEEKVQASSEFLGKINIVPVDEMKGSILGLGLSGTIASRTNTNTTDRLGNDPSTLDERFFELFPTEFDTKIAWLRLDMWAKFPDFQARIANQIVQRIALDRIMIGFNGRTAAASSDRVTNTLLQDLNIGWLQHMRLESDARVLGSATVAGVTTADPITVGPGGVYRTLDAAAWDMKQEFIAEHHRERTDMIVICGSALLHDKYFPLINADRDPTEQIARDVIMSAKRLGNMPAFQVPSFPANAMLVTPFDNLSIYYQDGKRRRSVIDNPRRNRIEDYQSSNEAYVVEDYEAAALAENIVIVDVDGD